MKPAIALTSATAAVLLAVALSTGDLVRVFLPMVRAAGPVVVDAPAGVTIHLTNPGYLVDGAGVVYAKTRASSDRGDVVWKIEDGRPVIVLEPGPDAAYGNGNLQVVGGVGVLITVNRSNQIVVYTLPGWTP